MAMQQVTRHKRTSKRRWIARAKLGKTIPLEAIVEHKLYRRITKLYSEGYYFDAYRDTYTCRTPSQS